MQGYHGQDAHLYVCATYPQCHAYVGVYRDDHWPRGTLANAELRHWREQAQTQFDRWWREGALSRSQADRSLRDLMGTKPHPSPISTFTLDQCSRLIALLIEG